ncbi:hypothetical protein SAMN02745857_03394 [Andreprevotia lacus DSM 23236]|uniref:Secretin n=1 Tax=Andreprevotia lacus DSM 23236 TaxID=1121001 RepID=A0A1W1XY39_9NEIS|nr:hypothetical protein [Andreprevotia lacus]SMC28767.1 hypothetical protein SAMN02745857_03394 [Andreprevotia lacus DSM 23236]
MPTIVRCLCALALLACAAGSQADVVDVVPLHHKLAGELAPTLQQAFPDASIQAFNGQLVVRAVDAVQFGRIARLASQLDTPNHQLTVTVEQRSNDAVQRNHVDVGGRVIVSPRHVGGSVEIEGRTDEHDEDSASIQSVSTMDGGRAMIALGQTRFYPALDFIYRPGYVIATHGGAWQQAETGFWVEPHVLDDRVQLRLYPRSNRLNADGSVSVRGVVSEVSGRLGEWLPVGTSDQHWDGSSGQRQGRYTVWVRVELR